MHSNRRNVQVKIIGLGHILCFPLDCSQVLLGHRLYTLWTLLDTLIKKSGLSFTYLPWISRKCRITFGHRMISLGKGCEKPVIRTISYWLCFLNHDWRIVRWCKWAWFPALYNDIAVTMTQSQISRWIWTWKLKSFRAKGRLSERWRIGCANIFTNFKRCETLTFLFDLTRLGDLHIPLLEKRKIKFAEHCNFFLFTVLIFNQYRLNIKLLKGKTLKKSPKTKELSKCKREKAEVNTTIQCWL